MAEQPAWKQGFTHRLAYYLIGLAIGLMLLGLFQMGKRWAQQQQAPANSPQPTPPK